MKYEESLIQQELVARFRFRYPKYALVLFHPVNEGKRTTKVIHNMYGSKVVCTGGARLKAEGMVKGVADLILLVPRNGFGALCLETKTRTGRQEPEQKEWQAAAEAAGNKYVVIRSAEEGMQVIEDYLGDEEQYDPDKENHTILQQMIAME